MPNVHVSYEEIQAQALRLQQAEAAIEEQLTTLRNQVQALVGAGFVTDSASRQFEASFQDFTTGASKTIEGLNGMANYLTRAANAFQTVDAELAAALG